MKTDAMKNKPKSMADIAGMLGITSTSVSLALRNSSLISRELREQVQRIAEENDFKTRSYRKRQPPQGAGGKVAVLYNECDAADPVAQQIMNSVMKRLTEFKIPFSIHSGEELKKNPSIVEGLAGVIYYYCFNPSASPVLDGIPQVAVMHEEIDVGPWDNFKPNERMAGKLAASYLLEQKFARTILVWEEQWAYHSDTHPRLEGFRNRVREAGAELVELSYDRHDESQAFLDGLIEVLKRFDGKAGIFAFNDQVAYKVCHTLNFAGFQRKPKEFEVISCDNTALIKGLYPPLPVVDLHISEIAARAVEGLMWRLANPESSFQDVLIKPDLILPPAE